jgi:hypothetical protein
MLQKVKLSGEISQQRRLQILPIVNFALVTLLTTALSAMEKVF